MRFPLSRYCLAVTIVFLAGAGAGWAQTFTGGLRGAVSDSGGVVPGVTVTLLNEASGASRETIANAQGQYNFPAVPPGTYTVKAALTGFKTYENKGVRIGTQQFITLDISLDVGRLEETITVTGAAPLIETSNASTGGTLNREALAVLPAPGRNAFLIGITIPTVSPVGDPQFNRQQDQTNASRVSLGGGGIRANNYLLDGVPITELRGRAVLNPTIEALEEVKVQVHTYDAEMGRTGGGVFNVTARAGTNEFHGSGFYQTRPVWGVDENFFVKKQGLSKEESGLSSTYYRLYGGGFGGPIWKNRTFFWTALEGYRSNTTRNEQQIWPSVKQRAGDFSTSTVGGVPVTIYNPYCRGGVSAKCPATGTGSLATGGLFTGAVIPRTHPAANAAGFGLLGAWPTETIAGAIASNENNLPNAIATGPIVDSADMYTVKAEHKFTDKWSLSGLYIYNKTDEPGSTIMKEDAWYIASQDNFFGPLRRRPHVMVLNNTTILNDTTVVTLRYGWSTWQDSCDKQAFSAGIGSLGFSPNYAGAVAENDVFPSLTFNDGVQSVGGWGGGPVRWKSPYSINGTLSKLWGSHSLKAGADARRIAVALATESAMGGTFDFNRLFTSNAGVGGHELASVLLGAPASGSVPFNRGEYEWFSTYYGAYLQDDWRVNQRLTVNFGLRLEHEDGLQEIENRQTVAFDQNAVSPLNAVVPKTGLLAGRTLNGGLVFAGVDGAPTQQGNPAAIKVAPRGGFTYSLNGRTVVRGGYGLFYAPWNYSTTQHGQIGFSQRTSLQQNDSTTGVPLNSLENPFPTGLTQPFGSARGLLTSTGDTVDFIDQNKGDPKVHQYSIDVQRELPGGMAVTVGYVGATGRDIGYEGTNSAAININQIDPDVARRVFPGPNGTWNAAALRALVPNPFFGVAGAGGFASRATIPAGQLLRPFPQFGDVNQFEHTDGGRRQYNAATFVLDKRTTGWWGGRFSYTLSRTEDNQFGESSVFQTRTAIPQNNYDLDAEYGISHFDSPHRIILAPIFKFGGSGGNVLLRGWNASAVFEFVSGSPLNAVLSGGASDANLGLLGGRQRPNLTGDPNTSGSDNDRVATDDDPAALFFNRGAFTNAGAGQFGNAPRTIGDARYQFRKNIDLVIAKDTTFFGTHSGQVRFEILNLTNTPKFSAAGLSNSVDSTAFGRITAQAGFMRIWQLSFRYSF